jgi:hypothetical protein
MIKHIALFKFKAGVTQEQRDELFRRALLLPEQVPGVIEFDVYRDILGAPQSYDLGLFASFTEKESLLKYGDHPARVATGKFAQELCDSIIIFDYETPREAH